MDLKRVDFQPGKDITLSWYSKWGQVNIICNSTETVKEFGRTEMEKGLHTALSERDDDFKE
jgi:hypothetical protein